MNKIQQILGVPVWKVGGCVRDLLRGGAPHDIDLACALAPEESVKLLEAAGLRVIQTGLQHGTITVMVDGEAFELTTFRADVATDGRHAQVKWVASLEEDLARRDFTCNAMAMSQDGLVVDPFHGQRDIDAGVLRAVGDPHKRFQEDRLRVVRACRFAARFGWKIEAQTWQAMLHEAMFVLDSVSVERMVGEFDKAFEGTGAASRRFLELMWELGLVQNLMPEFRRADTLMQNPIHHPEGSVLAHTLEVVERAPANLRWAALLHDVGKMATAEPHPDGFMSFHNHELVGAEMVLQIGRRLKMPVNQTKLLSVLTRHHMRSVQLVEAKRQRLPRKVREFQAQVAADAIRLGMTPDQLLKLHHMLACADAGPGRREWSLFTPVDVSPVVTSAHLFALGVKPGPHMGRLLRAAHTLQLSTGRRDPDSLLRHLTL